MSWFLSCRRVLVQDFLVSTYFGVPSELISLFTDSSCSFTMHTVYSKKPSGKAVQNLQRINKEKDFLSKRKPDYKFILVMLKILTAV